MGKKTKKRPRWRKLSLDDGEERRSPSPGHSEGGGGVASQRDKYRPRSRTSFARSHSVTTYVFDEDEYTKIQTPRQDMIFKKSAFTRRRAPADGSLSEEAETLSVGAGSEPATPSGPPPEQTSSATPELSEVSSEGKPASECGEGSEPRDPLAALASQIQYAFIDPQGNVYFNVMDESGIIHLPPVAGYYMAPSYPGGPLVATPVPWQAVPIAPLDSPEYQALLRRQQQQQQTQQQTEQQEQQPDQQPAQQPADGQEDGQQEQQPCQQQQTQELANGETSSLAGSRPRSEMSDDVTSVTGSRPTSPPPPNRHNSSGPEHEYHEPEQQISPGDEGKTRRLKKKKKKQKKKTNSVDSGVTDDGSDGCREPPPTPDCAAICSSDSSASGGRVRAEHKTSELAASDLTSSGVQSDVSLPDSPQRRPSGDHIHVTSAVLADTGSRDGQLLHSAATVLSRQLDTQLKMQPAVAAPQLTAQPPVQVTAQPPVQVTAQATVPVTAQPLTQHPKSQPKNESAAVSALEAAILSQVQLSADAGLQCGDPPQPSAAQDTAASGCDATDAPAAADAADDASEGDSPERELVDDDAESCDSFVYEDKSLGEPAASPPPTGDFLDDGAAPPASETTDDTSRKSSCASQVSEVVAEFEDEPVAPRAFTDLSQLVDLRRTVIMEETESERDRESSPGSVDSQESSRLTEKESSEERQVRSSEERQVRSSEERLGENSGKLQELCREEMAVKEPVVEEIVSATAALEVSAMPDVNLPSKEGSLIEGLVYPPSTEAHLSAPPVAAPCAEASLPKDTAEPSPVLPSDVAADLTKEAPKALSSASNVANPLPESAAEMETPSVSGTVLEPAPVVSLQPHLAAPAPDTSPPPDGAPPPPSPPSPPSSLSDRSISSAVRGWLKDQSPEAVFVVADDSDGDDDSDLDDDDADWESDTDAAPATATTPATPPKNARGNPSPVRRSSAGAGERVAIRSKAPAARLNTAAYYSLGVALDEPASPPAVLRLVDLDERAVLTVPLNGAAPAGTAAADSDGSEEVDTGVLGAPAPAAPPRASLAQELLQVGSLHRASDRQLIGDSALFSDAAVTDSTSAASASASKTVASTAAEVEADEGYSGSPLASPEARPRPRGLPPHPLHHIGAEAPAPWGVCCSLQ